MIETNKSGTEKRFGSAGRWLPAERAEALDRAVRQAVKETVLGGLSRGSRVVLAQCFLRAGLNQFQARLAGCRVVVQRVKTPGGPGARAGFGTSAEARVEIQQDKPGPHAANGPYLGCTCHDCEQRGPQLVR